MFSPPFKRYKTAFHPFYPTSAKGMKKQSQWKATSWSDWSWFTHLFTQIFNLVLSVNRTCHPLWNASMVFATKCLSSFPLLRSGLGTLLVLRDHFCADSSIRTSPVHMLKVSLSKRLKLTKCPYVFNSAQVCFWWRNLLDVPAHTHSQDIKYCYFIKPPVSLRYAQGVSFASEKRHISCSTIAIHYPSPHSCERFVS